ncbi:MAG: type II toxin-antitoxin system YafQ family toxin [Leptospiraceae bacterium]|nr:type II toxin-antitoxin system YafQ family toxin [Leptospiraceae bacterium]
MLKRFYSNSFKKDFKAMKRRKKSLKKLFCIMRKLSHGRSLDPKNKNHFLKGDYKDMEECHIEPDWLLIYQRNETKIAFLKTGSHSDLF